MKKIEFVITGKPKGKARPRFFRGRVITPKPTRLYEKHIKECYMSQAKEKEPVGMPVALRMDIYMKPPCTINKKYVNKQKKEQMLRNDIRVQGKPDIDNIIKIVLDGLNGVAYLDDAQVYEVKAKKIYSDVERIEVQIII